MSVAIFVGQRWVQLPLNKIILVGSIDVSQETLASSATLDNTQFVILADATSGVISLSLPPSTGIDGRTYHIKKTDSSSNAVTINPSGAETLDGELTVDLDIQYEALHIITDGSNWSVL